MAQIELGAYDVYYVDYDNTIDLVRFNAEDEQHAREKFEMFYPRVEIFRVEYRGEA